MMTKLDKLAYIIAKMPGASEAFFIPEMLYLKDNVSTIIIPRDISDPIVHRDAGALIENTLVVPLFNGVIFMECLKYLCKNPLLMVSLFNKVVFKARNVWIATKNLSVIPKALYLATRLREENVTHVHAQWGSTTSTMAYIISRVIRVSWSFTVHRWDIYENNILKEKLKESSFVRCISHRGKDDLLSIVGDGFSDKAKVIHVGVIIPDLKEDYIIDKFNDWNNPDKVFSIVLPANLLPVKGHKYLIEALSILNQKGLRRYKCIFFGDGPLKNDLEKLIKEESLTGHIFLNGRISHEELMQLYKDGKVDMVILPSIVTEEGEFEGIPVSLIEAMAHGVPVISTKTGSIPELLLNDAGILLEQRSSLDLADAILNLINNKKLAIYYGLKGYEKVKSGFSVYVTTQFLEKEISL